MDCSTPGFPIHHQLLEFTQTHVHRVSDAIQSSHPLSSPSPPAFNISQHQGLFASGGQSIGVSASALVLPMNISGLISFRMDWLDLLAVKGLSRVFSNTTVQKHHSSALSFLYSPTLTSVHDYWKNYSFDCMDFCQQSDIFAFNTLLRFVIAFLLRSQRLVVF